MRLALNTGLLGGCQAQAWPANALAVPNRRCVPPRQLSTDANPSPRPAAGHFIPLLAQAIVEYNKGLPAGEAPIPLEGYAIGNAWSDPVRSGARSRSAARMLWSSLAAAHGPAEL